MGCQFRPALGRAGTRSSPKGPQRPSQKRDGTLRVTTSWSIPNSPPDGPQAQVCGPFYFAELASEAYGVRIALGACPQDILRMLLHGPCTRSSGGLHWNSPLDAEHGALPPAYATASKPAIRGECL